MMTLFPHPLAAGEALNEGDFPAAIGFLHDGMFISDPTLCDSGGRWSVDPQEAYGLTPEHVQYLRDLNDHLKAATESAINAGCLSIQQALGVTSGDTAGMHFGTDAGKGIANTLADYLVVEATLQQQDPPDAARPRDNL